MKSRFFVFAFSFFVLIATLASVGMMKNTSPSYPEHWWTPVLDKDAPAWEVLPQAAKRNQEVILSKRNELGILSNFAHTPFDYRGTRYESIEGFWQMMLYPEQDHDPRNTSQVVWKYTRSEVSKMIAFEAKTAGTLAEKNMHILNIPWVSFEGEQFQYRSRTKGRHYELIREAMVAKLNQNIQVNNILRATGALTLLPDHHPEENAPSEWKYNEIWMELRDQLAE